MKISPTKIDGVFIINTTLYEDERGFFYESWNKKEFDKVINQDVNFVQDNYSKSFFGSIRGLHYQLEHPQAKLIRVVFGEVRDIVVDLRESSKTFGEHLSINLTAKENNQIWIPVGCAHGFSTLTESADIVYKVSDYYYPEDERCIKHDDFDLKIDWGLCKLMPKISEKDAKCLPFRGSKYFE
jgi:dTDP-4-dehydrorhamnose 3,5-epimerase